MTAKQKRESFFFQEIGGGEGGVAMGALLFPNQRNPHFPQVKPNLFSILWIWRTSSGATEYARAEASWLFAATCKALEERNRQNKMIRQRLVKYSSFQVSSYKSPQDNVPINIYYPRMLNPRSFRCGEVQLHTVQVFVCLPGHMIAHSKRTI